MVKVSIIVPVYNVESYLKQCLESLINQTFKDIEIICVNDGSTDNSLAILESFAKSDKRVKIIDQINQMSGVARNVGMKNSSGDYIYFVDSDDYISLDTIEKLYSNAISNDSDLVFSKIARFDEMGEINFSIPGFPFEKIFPDVDFNNFTFDYGDIKSFVMNASFAPWIKLYKKEFLDSDEDLVFPEEIIFEDVPFHIKVLLKASKMSFVPEFFYFYRFNSNSNVHTSKNGSDIFKICDIVEEYLIEKKLYGEFKDEFDLFRITQILNYIISTGEEAYFQEAKERFSKIKISSNAHMGDYFLKRYQLVLDSNTLIEYINGHFEISISNLNGHIRAITNNFENQIENLTNEKNDFIKEIDNLSFDKELYEEKLANFKDELDCLSNRNKKLTEKNKKLVKTNEKQKAKIESLKKSNKLMKNSKSWKLTKPLRTIMNKLR